MGLALAGLGCLLCGCGSGLVLVPVSGAVTIDGQPAEAIDVYFVPDVVDTGGPAGEHPHTGAHGVTDASGKYTLTQLDTDSSGTTAGKYTVRLADTRAGLSPRESATPIPSRLGKGEGKDLHFEVSAKGTTSADFNIESGLSR